MTRFGDFDDQDREYLIWHPDTPLPWINYLGSEEYFGIISNTAGGYSFYRDARLRRLTRYRYNNAPTDTGGRSLYLRDRANGDVWSPSWQPVRADIEDYLCRHGLGYTVIESTRSRIVPQTVYFVPMGESLEIWRTRITNHRRSSASLSLFSAIEFCLWDAWDDQTNLQRNYSTGEVEVAGNVIYHTTEYRERRNHFAFFACSEELAGFDTQRDTFLGPYRGWDHPLAVERGPFGELDRARLGADRLPSRRIRAGSSRDPGDRLRPRVRGEPSRREVRSAGLPDARQATGGSGDRAIPANGGGRARLRSARGAVVGTSRSYAGLDAE